MASDEPSKTSTGRPSIIGAETGPEPPYPLQMEGKVISGFGRGSKELGIPTANLPVDSSVTHWIDDIASGVYFGWASLLLDASHPDRVASSSGSIASSGFTIYPMVMSIGYNPFYGNTTRSAEVHVLHGFRADFYGAHMRLLLLGYVRPELDYSGLEALVRDIRIDCDVARSSLDRPAWTPRVGVVGQALQKGDLECAWLVAPLEEEEEEGKAEDK